MDQSSRDLGAGLSRTEGPGQEVGLGKGPGSAGTMGDSRQRVTLSPSGQADCTEGRAHQAGLLNEGGAQLVGTLCDKPVPWTPAVTGTGASGEKAAGQPSPPESHGPSLGMWGRPQNRSDPVTLLPRRSDPCPGGWTDRKRRSSPGFKLISAWGLAGARDTQPEQRVLRKSRGH